MSLASFWKGTSSCHISDVYDGCQYTWYVTFMTDSFLASTPEIFIKDSNVTETTVIYSYVHNMYLSCS